MTSPSETGETAPTDHGGSDTVQYLAPDGTPLPDADLPALSDETLVRMYEDLVFARRFDERATSLQRQGRISTWAPMAGQEASQIASTVAMAEEDYLYPTYRDNAAKFVHGTDPAAVLARLAGHVDASDDAAVAFGAAERVFPESIPIASHLPHAVGGAMATTYQDGDAVHVAHFGDGATSEGDFHEALNFAGVFDVPTVFVCHNNGWAISVPREQQTASETLAQKAEAYGFEGVRVDGMDPLAVHDVMTDALGKARDDGDTPRPTMVEAVEYRLGAHTTADDPDVYRDGVPDEWLARDPVPRFETFLREDGLLDDERVATIADRADDRVADAVERAGALETTPEAMFEHTYAEPTPRMADQRAELERLREELGDEAFRRD